jgi:hypothetical protein
MNNIQFDAPSQQWMYPTKAELMRGEDYVEY